MRFYVKSVLSTLTMATMALSGCGTQPQTPSAHLSETSSEADLTSEITNYVVEVETPKNVLNLMQESPIPFQDQMVDRKDLNTGKISDAMKLLDLGKIVNIGKSVWQVVEKNQPVMNIKHDYATALPLGIQSAAELTNFSDLQHISYRLYGKNLYGITVYDVTYTLVHQYGGSFDGQGHYLATVAVIPSNVSVMWGYRVNFATTNVSTLNIGTENNPVASLSMELKFEVSTILKKHTTTAIYQFRGDSPVVNSSHY